MADAITNTSPLLYLHRVGALGWLPALYQEIWVPTAVVLELREGQRKGYDVPVPSNHEWLKITDPKLMPSEWLALELGKGELAAMALALENPARVVLLDDALARRTATAAGLIVHGTLRIMLEAKSHGLIERVEPWVDKLEDAGLWLTNQVRRRILMLAGERASEH